MDKVLVIIVTYNAHDWIHQCLDSVDMERYDAFVVDNKFSKNDVGLFIKNPTSYVNRIFEMTGIYQIIPKVS